MPQSVLVAEDERHLVEALTFLMRRAGYDVSIAHDGPTAVAMAQSVQPDLILLDIMLPGFDGFEVVSAIKREMQDRAPRIMMLTAKGHEKERRKAVALGVDEFVTKPFSNRDVVDRIRALLSQEVSEQ